MSAGAERPSDKQKENKFANTGPKRRPLPAGVVRVTEHEPKGIPQTRMGGIVARRDGTLMMAYPAPPGLQTGVVVTSEYRISNDAGKTWETPQPLNCGIRIDGIIRLQSGKLAAYGYKPNVKGAYFSSSPDDGNTWTTPVDIGIGAYQFYPYLHALSQWASGRLVLAGELEGLNAGRPDTMDGGAGDTYPYTQFGWGLWRGRVLFCEGHRGVEMCVTMVYYSDDEGLTWKQCDGVLFGWFDERGIPNGEGGILDVCEPTAAETKDGRVLMFMRSRTGRVLQSYSLDQGVTWLSVLPTELSASQTTPQLQKIPKTGDLLCVWNQVSGEEIRCGFQRGRLSAAISRDSGLTWENFKTLELCEGMAEIAHITPEFPIPRRLVGRLALGQLPDGYAMFTQPNVDIVGDQVFIRYARTWPMEMAEKGAPRNLKADGILWPRREGGQEESGLQFGGEDLMCIYPLEWFYR